MQRTVLAIVRSCLRSAVYDCLVVLRQSNMVGVSDPYLRNAEDFSMINAQSVNSPKAGITQR